MIDINTIEKIEHSDYTVRVGSNDDGYEAVVVTEGGGQEVNMHPFMQSAIVTASSEEEVQAPVVSAPHKHVAVGLAVDAYEWKQIDEDVTDGSELYGHTEIEGVSAEELIEELEEFKGL